MCASNRYLSYYCNIIADDLFHLFCSEQGDLLFVVQFFPLIFAIYAHINVKNFVQIYLCQCSFDLFIVAANLSFSMIVRLEMCFSVFVTLK